MLDACDRLGVLVMDETFDMWHAAQDRPRLRAPLRRLVGGRRRGDGPQGPQPPERDPLQHRQRDPRRLDSRPGCAIARALAEKVRDLDDTRLVTQAVSGLLVGGPEVFDELGSGRAADDETGVNTTHHERWRHHGPGDASRRSSPT